MQIFYPYQSAHNWIHWKPIWTLSNLPYKIYQYNNISNGVINSIPKIFPLRMLLTNKRILDKRNICWWTYVSDTLSGHKYAQNFGTLYSFTKNEMADRSWKYLAFESLVKINTFNGNKYIQYVSVPNVICIP